MTSCLTVENLHFCDGKGSLFRSALVLALNSFHYLFAAEEDKYYEEGYVDTHRACKIDQKRKNKWRAM